MNPSKYRNSILFKDSKGIEYFEIYDGDYICIRYEKDRCLHLCRYIDDDYVRMVGRNIHIESFMDKYKFRVSPCY